MEVVNSPIVAAPDILTIELINIRLESGDCVEFYEFPFPFYGRLLQGDQTNQVVRVFVRGNFDRCVEASLQR